jgi:hypothetical protein
VQPAVPGVGIAAAEYRHTSTLNAASTNPTPSKINSAAIGPPSQSRYCGLRVLLLIVMMATRNH